MKTNNGLIPVKLGPAFIIQSYQKLIHIIRLKDYSDLINNITIQENELSQIISGKSEYKYILNDKKTITSKKLEMLKETFHFLLPRRTKRGILDGLGSLIKDITGNLDNQDLIDIQNALHDIHNNEDALNKQINEQIHLNAEMINRLKEIQNFVTIHTDRLQHEINKTIIHTNLNTNVLLFDQHFYKINHIIDILHNHLKDITEIIQLSKYQIISRHLLNNNEIEYISGLFSQSNVRFDNNNFIYSLINLKGYYNNTDIIFSIEIPIFSRESFNYFKFKIIPMFNKIITPIPSYELIANSQKYQFIHKPCNNVNNQYFCDTMKLHTTSETCIPAIIMQLPAKCIFQETTYIEDIDYITFGKLYVQPTQPLSYTSSCNQQTTEITEPTLITFNNCTINIKNYTFTSKASIFFEKPIITLPYNKISTIDVKPNINLDQLHNSTIQNMKSIKMIQQKHILHTSTGHTALIIIIISIIIFIAYSVVHRCRGKPIKPNHIAFSSADFPKAPLRGEELHCEIRPVSSNVTTSVNRKTKEVPKIIQTCPASFY